MELTNMKQNKWFFTFGGPTENFHNSVKRICSEAKEIGEFDHIIGYNEKDLMNNPIFWNKHKDFILSSKRGYGYWLWKPFLTKTTFDKMKDNDILVYSDAGCQINSNGKARLQEYFDIVNKSKYANYSIQIPPYLEKTFTKMDAFNYYDTNQPDITDTGQLIATIFIIRKCELTVNLINDWYDGCCKYHLLDDTPSHIPNDPSFVTNRHDQSLFSVVRKKYGTEKSEFDETWFAPDWNSSGKNYPFWATRIR